MSVNGRFGSWLFKKLSGDRTAGKGHEFSRPHRITVRKIAKDETESGNFRLNLIRPSRFHAASVTVEDRISPAPSSLRRSVCTRHRLREQRSREPQSRGFCTLEPYAPNRLLASSRHRPFLIDPGFEPPARDSTSTGDAIANSVRQCASAITQRADAAHCAGHGDRGMAR